MPHCGLYSGYSYGKRDAVSSHDLSERHAAFATPRSHSERLMRLALAAASQAAFSGLVTRSWNTLRSMDDYPPCGQTRAPHIAHVMTRGVSKKSGMEGGPLSPDVRPQRFGGEHGVRGAGSRARGPDGTTPPQTLRFLDSVQAYPVKHQQHQRVSSPPPWLSDGTGHLCRGGV